MRSIRVASDSDRDMIWMILKPIFRAGESYPLPRDISREDALGYWLASGNTVFVAKVDSVICGTYYLRANQKGGGAHVANCGYAVAADAERRGVARAMAEHSLAQAKARGFRAMQFNFVVSSNERAVRLWTGLGFATVGLLPEPFVSPTYGPVDVLVMMRRL